MVTAYPQKSEQHTGKTSHAIEYIAWFLSIFTSVIVFTGVSLLLNKLWQPDISGALDLARKVSVFPESCFAPEPKEKTLFLLGLILLPTVFISSYIPLKRVLNKQSASVLTKVFPIIVAVSLISVIYISFAGLSATNPFHFNPQNIHDAKSLTNSQFYLLTTFLYEHPLTYLFIFYPLTVGLLWHREFWQQRIPSQGNKTIKWFCYCGCMGLILVIFAINTFRFPSTYENLFDLSAVYYSMLQVFSGSQLLVDGFSNTYGLYPHFLVPVFKITGLSIANFSAVMSLLTSFCFLMLLLFLRRQLKSTCILFFCFTSFVFYSHFFPKIVTPYDAVFAGQPIRLLFPVLSLYLAGNYLEHRTKKYRNLSLLILAMGILWNPEFGVFTYGAFTLFLLSTELLNSNKTNVLWNVLHHITAALVSLVLTFYVYAITIRMFYGSYPDLLKMFSALKIFSLIGFNMLPMPLLHPWNLVAFIIFLGICTILVAVATKSFTPFHSIILIVTLHCLGNLMYYQGRSHNWNLIGSMAFSFILLALFSDYLLSNRLKSYFVPWAVMIFILGSSVFQLSFAHKEIISLINDVENKKNFQPSEIELTDNASFIKGCSSQDESVLILSHSAYQTYYYALSGTKAVFNPGLIEFFWKTDLNRLLYFLRTNKKVKIFIEPNLFDFNTDVIIPILKNQYEIRASNGKILLMLPR